MGEFLKWTVGNVQISRILEIDPMLIPPNMIISTDPETVRKYDWLRPHFASDDGLIWMHIQTFVIEADGKRIIVDPCIGNNKKRESAFLNEMNGPYLSRLADAGYPREDIDFVLCTHLHVDHCGWNTMLVDGNWVPTFPNAAYLFARNELEHAALDRAPDQEATYADSVRPILDAGLAKIIDLDFQVTPSIRLEHSPGHTPGHCCVIVSSEGQEAIITGDVIHHPVQAAETEVCSVFCLDRVVAEKTRRNVLSKAAENGRLMIGTHFSGPTGVRVFADGSNWRVEPY
jgi:glyoxylase-like metal-dependent hydrolase (beta-lactamase superfamily II)